MAKIKYNLSPKAAFIFDTSQLRYSDGDRMLTDMHNASVNFVVDQSHKILKSFREDKDWHESLSRLIIANFLKSGKFPKYHAEISLMTHDEERHKQNWNLVNLVGHFITIAIDQIGIEHVTDMFNEMLLKWLEIEEENE